MINIATLATCHNRIEFTRSSLTSLYNQIDNQKIFSFTHIIVDDGSTDGTLDMISKEFPEVRVIKGDGNLYWAGGMRLGWENISNTLKEFRPNLLDSSFTKMFFNPKRFDSESKLTSGVLL